MCSYLRGKINKFFLEPYIKFKFKMGATLKIRMYMKIYLKYKFNKFHIKFKNFFHNSLVWGFIKRVFSCIFNYWKAKIKFIFKYFTLEEWAQIFFCILLFAMFPYVIYWGYHPDVDNKLFRFILWISTL